MDTCAIYSSPSVLKEDSKELHEPCNRLSKLLQSLIQQTSFERLKIKEMYTKMYGEDLIDYLQQTQESNPKNEICSMLLLWTVDPHERDAMIARDALTNRDVNYRALMEIYIGRKSNQLLLIKQSYKKKYKRSLDYDIVYQEHDHPFKKILVALSASHNSHRTDVSHDIAKTDAMRLHEAAGRRSRGFDEAVILELFCKRSIPQMRLALYRYKHIYGLDYSKTLKKKSCEEFEDCLRAAVDCMYTPSKYYCKILYDSLKGRCADKGALTRIMVRQGEANNMREIKKLFKMKYKKELYQILRETLQHGDYRDFMVAVASTT